jgi:hypothetical protein
MHGEAMALPPLSLWERARVRARRRWRAGIGYNLGNMVAGRALP